MGIKALWMMGLLNAASAPTPTPATWSSADASGPGASTTPALIALHAGDVLPIEFNAHGDLLESVNTGPTTLKVMVQRDVWLKLHDNGCDISLDGVVYQPLQTVFTGQLRVGLKPPAGADEGGVSIDLDASVRTEPRADPTP